MPKVDVEGESSKKKKKWKGKEKKQKIYIYILNHEHVFGICNKPLASSKCLDWLSIKEIVGFAIWFLLREF
jgi:hypothetical protein